MENSLHYEGDYKFPEFLAKVADKLKEWKHKANAYFFATGCGLGSYGLSKRKLLRFIEVNPEYSLVEDKEALKRGSHLEKQMALKTAITSADELETRFRRLFHRSHKLTASCGCSIFLSDAQELRITVLRSDHQLGIE